MKMGELYIMFYDYAFPLVKQETLHKYKIPVVWYDIDNLYFENDEFIIDAHDLQTALVLAISRLGKTYRWAHKMGVMDENAITEITD